MNGYVKNMTHLWSHTMKRTVGPGAKIPLDELFAQYGERHNLKKGKEFIQWLQDVKLRDRNKWQIFQKDDQPYEEDTSKKEEVKSVVEVKVEEKQSKGDNVAPPVAKDLSVDDVVELSVRKAREVVPLIQDIQLLKYAENQANQRAGKDSLRRILMKRIQELSVSNRR